MTKGPESGQTEEPDQFDGYKLAGYQESVSGRVAESDEDEVGMLRQVRESHGRSGFAEIF